MEIIIEKTKDVPVQKSAIEIVERKGLGHPDTLSDRAAEELSIAFSKYYLKKFGRETTHKWLSERMRCLEPEKNVVVETKIRTGSVDLRATFDSSIPLANDTSIGVGFSPLTETESLAYKTEQFLNSAEVKRAYPMVGEDIKIMGIRMHDHINLTIAIAFISKFISSKEEYFKMKTKLLEYIQFFVEKLTSREVTITINAADSYKKDIYYLTVTGTSAECGDDGQVGRGNRAN